jgi:CRISPR-associated protein Cmr2
MNYLLLLTISPVQSFIAQARKTKDLYAGSQILSQLCKVGISKAEELGAEIIFPYVDITWQNQSLPNRFIAKIDSREESTKDAETIKQIGINIENTIRESFEKQADNLLSPFKSLNTDFEEAFWKQIKGHLDIHWVIVPIKKNEKYVEAFEKSERILGSVKNLRSFTQNPEVGRKCSLDGQNNALFFGFHSNSNYVSANKAMLSKDLSENEGLSAVSMLKRSSTIAKFSSTAKIALMYNESTLTKEAKPIFDDYINLFNEQEFPRIYCKYLNSVRLTDNQGDLQTEFDDQLLYRENITEKYIPNKYQLDSALAIFDKIEKYFKDKYYAIIHFDGDKMGKLISGSRLQNDNDKSDETLPRFQRTVSKLLSDFAKWASQTYLIAPRGQTIYAGGDDFLGFVNLAYLLVVVQELRDGFDNQVNKHLKSKYNLDGDFTFSAGIVIAHYKEPLSLVLEQVRQAEKIAKDKGGRNAFILMASKGLGEMHQTCFKWEYQNTKTLEIAKELVNWLNEGKISRKFIVSFATEMDRLMEDGNYQIAPGNYHADIIKIELQRLMLRAKQSAGEQEIKDFAKKLSHLLLASKGTTDNFLQFLYICDFISRHINQPQPELV